MPNTPAYILYHGKATGKDKQGKKIWSRIGAAWSNKSGKGFNRAQLRVRGLGQDEQGIKASVDPGESQV